MDPGSTTDATVLRQDETKHLLDGVPGFVLGPLLPFGRRVAAAMLVQPELAEVSHVLGQILPRLRAAASSELHEADDDRDAPIDVAWRITFLREPGEV